MRQAVTILLLFVYIVPSVLSAGAAGNSRSGIGGTAFPHSEKTKKNGCKKNTHIPNSPVKQPVKAKALSHGGTIISSLTTAPQYLSWLTVRNIKYFIPGCSNISFACHDTIWQPPRSC